MGWAVPATQCMNASIEIHRVTSAAHPIPSQRSVCVRCTITVATARIAAGALIVQSYSLGGAHSCIHLTYYMVPWAHTRPWPQNSISIGLASFAAMLNRVTDRQTDTHRLPRCVNTCVEIACIEH